MNRTVIENTDEETKGAWPLVVINPDAHSEEYKRVLARPYPSYLRLTDSWGNNKACVCKEKLQLNIFCVCIARYYCPSCGRGGCVGGHD